MPAGLPDLNESQVTVILPENVLVEGPVRASSLMGLTLDEGCRAFRKPESQKPALVKIALMPEGKIFVARKGGRVVGYVAVLPPDPRERWGREKITWLLELGAIEVSPAYRGRGVATALLDCTFNSGLYEDYVVIASGVYWHWDLRGTDLNVYQYRAMLLAAVTRFGFQVVPTDEADVQEHPANFLIARVGGNAPPATVKKFYRLCFMGRGASPHLRILPHKNGQARSD